MFRVTIFRKQNGGWTHLRKNNIFLEDGDQVLLRKENKKNGIQTPLVRKEDKKGGNEPQTTILNLLTDKIGLLTVITSETDLKFGGSKSTNRSTTILVQCIFARALLTAQLIYRSKWEENGFWKKATRLPWRQSIPVKNRWSWKWPDEILTYPLDFGPMNTR